MRVAALSLAILVTITAAQAQRNPALTGEPRIGALPEVKPFETEADIQQGAALFQTHCSYCHGVRGEGGRGADLTAGEYRMGGSDQELFKTIRKDRKSTRLNSSHLGISYADVCLQR